MAAKESISVGLEPGELAKIRRLSAHYDRSIGYILREAVTEYLSNRENDVTASGYKGGRNVRAAKELAAPR